MKQPKKILFVFGTRPEAIKMAPVLNELKRHDKFCIRVCVTGQHRQMLDQVLSFFQIIPDFDLQVMTPGQSLADITTNVLLGMKNIFMQWRPDLIFVHGDTTTAMATSLAAFYEKIKVAHIEAGLRTHNIYSPWPEELNRQIVSKISALNFSPTNSAKKNLLAEGFSSNTIFVTGNTVIDALLEAVNRINSDEGLNIRLRDKFNFIDETKQLILVTGHRRENFGEGFENICNALRDISLRGDVQIVYPVHLNPKVQEPVQRILGDCSNIHLIEPQDYLPFVYLMNRSHIILTDSGGIQEEAPSLGKPVLVMRDVTERPEAVEMGAVKLVGTNREHIVSELFLLLDNSQEYLRMSNVENPYGDGRASKRICSAILALD